MARSAFLIVWGLVLAELVPSLIAEAAARENDAKISVARQSDAGFAVHEVKSIYQPGVTQIRVLLPDDLGDDERLPVVFVLPVEAKLESRYGDGLLEIKQRNLHNRQRAIYAAPTFAQLPWYADHATDPLIRQETYFTKVVAPFVVMSYPVVSDVKQHHLLGFSKSGWGAWSLLLRHPDQFGRAVAWDAPLMMATPRFGSKPIFGDIETFRDYQLSTRFQQIGADFRKQNRLVLTGYDNFRQHHRDAHKLLVERCILHSYRDGPAVKHTWHSGWVAEAVELLLTKPNVDAKTDER